MRAGRARVTCAGAACSRQGAQAEGEKTNESRSKIRYLPFGQINPTMGKKGKRGDKPAEKKAIPKRIDALAKKLEKELEGADLFAPLPPMDDCPICLVRLPRLASSMIYRGCCGKTVYSACFDENDRVIKKMNSQTEGNGRRKSTMPVHFVESPSQPVRNIFASSKLGVFGAMPMPTVSWALIMGSIRMKNDATVLEQSNTFFKLLNSVLRMHARPLL